MWITIVHNTKQCLCAFADVVNSNFCTHHQSCHLCVVDFCSSSHPHLHCCHLTAFVVDDNACTCPHKSWFLHEGFIQVDYQVAFRFSEFFYLCCMACCCISFFLRFRSFGFVVAWLDVDSVSKALVSSAPWEGIEMGLFAHGHMMCGLQCQGVVLSFYCQLLSCCHIWLLAVGAWKV